MKRRRVARAAVVLLAVFGAPGPAAHAGPPDESTREYRYLMGTSILVEASGGEEALRRLAIDEAFAAMVEVDRLMSNYRDDSELARINRTAGQEPVTVSDPMLSILQAAQKVSLASGGAFDMTVGPLVRLWGFHDKQPHLPTAAELAQVRPLVGYQNVVIDEDRHTVRFARPGVELDLGGIAKGFAVELAAGVLRRHGLGGFIDAGGNQYLLGRLPGKASWSVGIKSPDAPDRLLGMLELGEGSVATSSQGANFLSVGGRRYGHLLDPRTLQPSEASLSVTVVSPDGTLGDALTKAAFLLGPRQGLKVMESFPQTVGLIAYRKPDGSVGVAVSKSLAGRFRREPASGLATTPRR